MSFLGTSKKESAFESSPYNLHCSWVILLILKCRDNIFIHFPFSHDSCVSCNYGVKFPYLIHRLSVLTVVEQHCYSRNPVLHIQSIDANIKQLTQLQVPERKCVGIASVLL